METGIPEPPAPVRTLLQRGAARWWWAPLVAGLIWFLIAWLVLRANYTSLATVGVLIGIVFLVAAVNEAVLAGIVAGGWQVLHVVLAVVFVLGAVWAFVRPINTFFALASVLGLLLFLQGFLSIARGAAMRDESPYWWLELGSGVLIVSLALWVSTSDRVWTLAARSAFLLLWVGLMAVCRGISDIALAFGLRRFGQQAVTPGTEPETGKRRRPCPSSGHLRRRSSPRTRGPEGRGSPAGAGHRGLVTGRIAEVE